MAIHPAPRSQPLTNIILSRETNTGFSSRKIVITKKKKNFVRASEDERQRERAFAPDIRNMELLGSARFFFFKAFFYLSSLGSFHSFYF